MKSIWKHFLFILLLSITGLLATAEEPQIPANAWEQHPEGVALALMLTNGKGDDSQSTYLVLYVKNTSNDPESLVTVTRGASAIFFYLDSSGSPVTLGNHNHPNQLWKDLIESNQRLRIILPGKIIKTGTEITDAEATLLKTKRLQCKIFLNDPTTKKDVPITGSPQLLTSAP